MKKIKFTYLYFILLISFIIGYFINFSIKEIFIAEVIDEYLGIMIIPFLIFLFLYGFIFFIEDQLKREVAEIKLYFSLIIVLSVTFLFILYKTGLNFLNYQKFLLDENFFNRFLNISIYKYRLGNFVTYLFYLLLKINIKFSFLLLGIFFVLFLSLFLIIYAPIKNYIKKIVLRHKVEKESLRKEKLLQEQIKIKEALDKKIMRKEMKFKENKERIVEEKVEAFRKDVKLQKMITIDKE